MSIPHSGEVRQLADLLAVLREMGVSEFRSGDFVLVLRDEARPTAAAAAQTPVSVTIPATTPELPGKADAFEALLTPKRDIFDIIESGVIPGAPTRDGLPSDPDPS